MHRAIGDRLPGGVAHRLEAERLVDLFGDGERERLAAFYGGDLRGQLARQQQMPICEAKTWEKPSKSSTKA